MAVDFEHIRQQVIKELCKGEKPTDYLEGVNDTLAVIKRLLDYEFDDGK